MASPFQMLQARLRAEPVGKLLGQHFLHLEYLAGPPSDFFFLSLQGSTDRCVHPKPKSASYMHRPLLHARSPSDQGPSGGCFSANDEKKRHSQEDRVVTLNRKRCEKETIVKVTGELGGMELGCHA